MLGNLTALHAPLVAFSHTPRTIDVGVLFCVLAWMLPRGVLQISRIDQLEWGDRAVGLAGSVACSPSEDSLIEVVAA